MNKESKKYIDLILEEPIKLGHWLGFTDLKDLHNEWIRDFILKQEDQTLLAHRNSYKTTCLSIAIPSLILLKPNNNIIFLRKTDTDTVEIINQAKNILKSDVFNHFSQKIYGVDIKLIKENQNEIDTNLKTSITGRSQLVGLGIDTSITGKHADLVITDDIVNIKDRVSKAKREATKISYMELQNIKKKSGRILNTGTPWHKEDAISIMPNVKMYDCYSTGIMTREEINKIREGMTPSLFSANYELKHIADEDALFTSPIFTDKTELIFNGVCHIDASYGGADGTSFTGIKKIGEKFVVYGKRWNKHVDNCINEILEIRKQLKLGTIYCENNGDKGYLARDLRKQGAIVSEYHEDMNKFIKISSYLKKYWKNIEFLEDTDPDYINEILDYTEDAEHDDSPDGLASMIRKLSGGTGLSVLK